MNTDLRASLIPGLLIVACAACSSGGGAAGPSEASLEMTRLSTPQGAVWQINRKIEFGFNFPVDFATVNSNTINIRSENGVPATGEYSFKRVDSDGDGLPDTVDEQTVVFQPNCPTQSDFSDAGLQVGGVQYTITLTGRSSGTNNTIRSQDGHFLEETQERTFQTPNSLDPSVIFLDTTAGPPLPVVRSVGAVVQNGVSYVEIGGQQDPSTRIYFEFDATTQTYSIAPGANAPAQVPLNLYSDEATRAAVLVEFNQAVGTSATNISDRRIRLEYQDAGGSWIPIETRVDLVSNCTETGASVRLQPVGLLPPGSRFRAVVRAGFRDLVGDTILAPIDGFAVAPTRELAYTSLTVADDGADEFFESFDFGGDSPNSFEEQDPLFDAPEALWGDGALTAAFDFQGAGGPGGNFDWVVRDGQIFVFDTTSTSIVGGPGGVPTKVQIATNGVVDVRNLVVEHGGVLRVQGNNTMLINATGEVRISGEIDLSGFNAKDVATLNTGQQPETGGAGAAGGGRGGAASEVITSSTPRGGNGFGPFGEISTGGQGGESGYAAANLGEDARRPGGGGGGRFAADFAPTSRFFAEAGYDGHPDSRGAESRQKPAKGGAPGRGPFADADTGNDFFGVRPLIQPDGAGGYDLTGLVRGELTRVWAGYGGGGGGDALPANTFPTPRWDPGKDEKGGGGGGAGGGLRIRALGQIVFGVTGKISSTGGHGGTGENTIWLDHVGGSGGSGSGGHVVLESAVRIDFADGNPGQGLGFVHVDVRGGPTYVGPKVPRDTVPCGISHGGSGGPGVIQLHVPSVNPPSDDPATSDILVSTKELNSPLPEGVLFRYTKPPGIQLIPTFGARSKARSKWIPIGGADSDPVAGSQLVRFLFEGLETTPGPDLGKVLRDGESVAELPPLLGPEPFSSATVALLSDGVTLRLTGLSLDPLIGSTDPVSKDLYLRTPSLLRHFTLCVSEVGNPDLSQDFTVVAATYDDANTALQLTVDPLAGTIAEFTGGSDNFEYRLLPYFFRIVTDGEIDSLPSSSFVRITLDATGDDGLGRPDEQNLLVENGTVADFNALSPGELQFFRFLVEFNLDQAGAGVTTATRPVSLDFLRLPFRF